MRAADPLASFPDLENSLNRTEIYTVSTFPPTQCGIATFTRDLVEAMAKFLPFSKPCIVAVNEEGQTHHYDHRVCTTIQQDRPEDCVRAAHWLNQSGADAVSIQHEHGIYRGPGGSYLTGLLSNLRKPVVTTLHTVLRSPTPDEKRAIQDVFRYSDRVVAMVGAARDLLRDSYEVDVEKLRIIPHGVPNIRRIPIEQAKRDLGLSGRQVVSTFGLLSRSKGIEDAVRAIALVAEQFPDVLYLVLGQTHPVVRRREGEEYRRFLTGLVSDLGIERNVTFDNRYLSLDEIIAYLNASDVYVTPYLGPDQIVSGTLSYALGCGKAIVSTPYLYARSVLGPGRGVLAEFESPRSIADGILRLLHNPEERKRVEEAAFRYGRRTTWHNVAIDYLYLFHQLAQKSAASRSYRDLPQVEEEDDLDTVATIE